MRFSYAESMTDPSYYLPLARAAEEAGFDSMVVPDSICYPEESDARYPYNPDGTREFLDGKPFLEPFSLIPAMGAVTETLRFITFVLKLPIRHPVLVAKQVSSTAVLTDNRLLLGVGTSPWPEDYAVCGVPVGGPGQADGRADRRAARPDGRGLLRVPRGGVRHPVDQDEPVPTKPVPILIGGHHEAALRRAARVGDGWLHGGGDPEDLPGLLARLTELRREYGTLDKDFEIQVISLDAYSPDGIEKLEELGVTDVIVGFRYPYDVGPDTETLADQDRQPAPLQ